MENISELLQQASSLIEEAHKLIAEVEKDNPLLVDKTSYLLGLLKVAQRVGVARVATEYPSENLYFCIYFSAFYF